MLPKRKSIYLPDLEALNEKVNSLTNYNKDLIKQNKNLNQQMTGIQHQSALMLNALNVSQLQNKNLLEQQNQQSQFFQSKIALLEIEKRAGTQQITKLTKENVELKKQNKLLEQKNQTNIQRSQWFEMQFKLLMQERIELINKGVLPPALNARILTQMNAIQNITDKENSDINIPRMVTPLSDESTTNLSIAPSPTNEAGDNLEDLSHIPMGGIGILPTNNENDSIEIHDQQTPLLASFFNNHKRKHLDVDDFLLDDLDDLNPDYDNSDHKKPRR